MKYWHNYPTRVARDRRPRCPRSRRSFGHIFSHEIGLAEQQVNAPVSSVLSTPFRRTEVTGGKVMNKFHVNIPEASQPHSVALVCRGQVVDKKPSAGVAETLTFTVNGSSSHVRAAAKAWPLPGDNP